jgi:WD40 repeat protein
MTKQDDENPIQPVPSEERPEVFALCRLRKRSRSTALLGAGFLGPTLLVNACSGSGATVGASPGAGGRSSIAATGGVTSSVMTGGEPPFLAQAGASVALGGMSSSGVGGRQRPDPRAGASSIGGTGNAGANPTGAAAPVASAGVAGASNVLAGPLRVNQQACAPFAAYELGVDAIAFSHDGTLLITGGKGSSSNQPTLKVWSVSSGELLQTLADRNPSGFDFRYDLAISPDDTLLVSAGMGGVELATLPGGEFLRQIAASNAAVVVQAVAVSPDGKMLAWATNSGWALWSLPDGVLLASDAHGAQDVAITPDGKLLLVEGSRGIDLRSLPDGNLVSTLPSSTLPSIMGGTLPMGRMVLSADGSTLAAIASDGSIMLWDLPGQALLSTLQTGDTDVMLLDISADATLLVTCTYQGIVKQWRLGTGELLGTITTDNGTPNAMCLSPSGNLLALGFGTITEKRGNLQLLTLPDGATRNCLYDPLYTQRTPMTVGQQRARQTDGQLCTCDLVCTCDAVAVAASTPADDGFVCTCNTVEVGSATGGSSGGGGGGYWYPN